jgi:hypothetical protein
MITGTSEKHFGLLPCNHAIKRDCIVDKFVSDMKQLGYGRADVVRMLDHNLVNFGTKDSRTKFRKFGH